MLSREIIFKKVDLAGQYLSELESLLATSMVDFIADSRTIRAAERNFQLVVDEAIDINTQILLELGLTTPDSYRQSFVRLGKAGVLPIALANDLSKSAELRNILVHEYDLEQDDEKFYQSAKKYAPQYREYFQALIKYLQGDTRPQ